MLAETLAPAGRGGGGAARAVGQTEAGTGTRAVDRRGRSVRSIAAIREGRTARFADASSLPGGRRRRTSDARGRVWLGGLRVHEPTRAGLRTRAGEERRGSRRGRRGSRRRSGWRVGEFERTRATRTEAGAPSAGGSEEDAPSARRTSARSRGRGTRRRRGGRTNARSPAWPGCNSATTAISSSGLRCVSTSCWLSARVDLSLFRPGSPSRHPATGPSAALPHRTPRVAVPDPPRSMRPRRRRASPGARPRPRPAPRRGATRPRPRARPDQRAGARHVSTPRRLRDRRDPGGSSARGRVARARARSRPTTAPGRRPARAARRSSTPPSSPRPRARRACSSPRATPPPPRISRRRRYRPRTRRRSPSSRRARAPRTARSASTRPSTCSPASSPWSPRTGSGTSAARRSWSTSSVSAKPWTISTPPSRGTTGVPLWAC